MPNPNGTPTALSIALRVQMHITGGMDFADAAYAVTRELQRTHPELELSYDEVVECYDDN